MSFSLKFGRQYGAPVLGVINSWCQHPNMVHSESLAAKATKIVFLHGQVKKLLVTDLKKKDEYGLDTKLYALQVAISTDQAEELLKLVKKGELQPGTLFQPTNPENGAKGAYRIKLNLKQSTVWTGKGAAARDPHGNALVKFGAYQHEAEDLWPSRTYYKETKEWRGGPEWCHYFVVHIGTPKAGVNKETGEQVLYDNLTVLGMSGRIPYAQYKIMAEAATHEERVRAIDDTLMVQPPPRFDGDHMVIDTTTENENEVRVICLVPFDRTRAQKIYG